MLRLYCFNVWHIIVLTLLCTSINIEHLQRFVTVLSMLIDNLLISLRGAVCGADSSKVLNVTANFNICGHNSKCDCKMLNVAVIIRNVTAKC